MRPISVIALVALTLAGCLGDPQNDVLRPGTVCVVATEDFAILDHDDQNPNRPQIKPGVMVRVGYDPGSKNVHDFECDTSKADAPDCQEQKAAYDKVSHPSVRPPDHRARYRKVQVTVESGAYQGHSGEVSRKDITPVR